MYVVCKHNYFLKYNIEYDLHKIFDQCFSPLSLAKNWCSIYLWLGGARKNRHNNESR